jgi:2-iminobutanoate/2-iminopropanoate deaminase
MLWSGTIAAAGPNGAFDADPEAQMRQAFANARTLLERHDGSPEEVGSVVVYIADQSQRAHINDAWLELFPTDHDRPARRTTQVQMPAGQFVQLQLTAVRGARRRELSVPDIAHRDPIPFGVALGDVVFSSGITGQDPASGEFGATADEQLGLCLNNMRLLVEAAGGTLANVAHVWTFMKDRADQQRLVDAWVRAFPTDGQRPARKTIRYDLAGNQAFQLQMTAVLGERKNFEIPGIGHHDPIPMGTLTGGLFMTSGIGGYDPGPGVGILREGLQAQTRAAVDNLAALCATAGGRRQDIGHVTAMIRSFDEASTVERELAARLPDASLHFTSLGLPGEGMEVQLHAAGCVSAR